MSRPRRTGRGREPVPGPARARAARSSGLRLSCRRLRLSCRRRGARRALRRRQRLGGDRRDVLRPRDRDAVVRRVVARWRRRSARGRAAVALERVRGDDRQTGSEPGDGRARGPGGAAHAAQRAVAVGGSVGGRGHPRRHPWWWPCQAVIVGRTASASARPPPSEATSSISRASVPATRRRALLRPVGRHRMHDARQVGEEVHAEAHAPGDEADLVKGEDRVRAVAHDEQRHARCEHDDGQDHQRRAEQPQAEGRRALAAVRTMRRCSSG